MSLYRLAAQITEAFLGRHPINPNDVPEFMLSVHNALTEMKRIEMEDVEGKFLPGIQATLDGKRQVIDRYQRVFEELNAKLEEARSAEYPTRAERRDVIEVVKDKITDAKDSQQAALSGFDETLKDLRKQLKDARDFIK